MKHERDQENDEQRPDGGEDLAEEKIGPISAGLRTALGNADYDGDATAEEQARGDDPEPGRQDEDQRGRGLLIGRADDARGSTLPTGAGGGIRMRHRTAGFAATLLALSLAGCTTDAPRPTPGAPASTPSTARTEEIEPTPERPPGRTPDPTSEPPPERTPDATPAQSAGTPTPREGVLFADDFSGQTRFLSSGSDPVLGGGEYVDGVYRMFAWPREINFNYASGATIDACLGDDCLPPEVVHAALSTAVVEVDVTHVSGDLGGSFGIACNYRAGGANSSFVGLTVSSDGRRHAIAMHEPRADYQSRAIPVDALLGGVDRGEPHPSIATGIGATNRLRAECGQTVFRLFANGTLVAEGALAEASADEQAPLGIALITGSTPRGRVDAEFDHLVVSELDAIPEVGLPSGEYFGDPLEEPSPFWFTGSQGPAEWSFTEDAYRLEILDELGGSGWGEPAAMVPPPDTSVAVDVAFVDSDDLAWAGLQCRASRSVGYGFDILPDGFFWIYRSDGGDLAPVPLIRFRHHEAIQVGLGRWNRLRLDCAGDTLTAFANGVRLGRVTDSTLEAGVSGLSAVSLARMTVDFANYSATYATP